MLRHCTTVAAISALSAGAAQAQDADQTDAPAGERGLFNLPAGSIDEPLVADRPDFTESALTVPVGRLQVEAGLTWSHDDDGDTDLITLGEPLLRLGLAQDFELRVGLPSIAFLSNGRDEEGLTDSSIGFKWRFMEEDGARPDLAVLGSLTLPTGEDPFGQDGVHPGAVLAAGWDLSEEIADGWGLGVNVGAFELEGDDWEATWSAALAIPIDDTWGAFAEYFAISPDGSLSRTAHAADFGLTYLVHANLQLDVRIGFGLSDEAPDVFTGAGFAYRF